jgi:hypothetical protein
MHRKLMQALLAHERMSNAQVRTVRITDQTRIRWSA